MKATDARRHSPEKLEVLRARGFAMRREGFRVVEIAQALGVVRGTVYKWFRNAEVRFTSGSATQPLVLKNKQLPVANEAGLREWARSSRRHRNLRFAR